MRVRLSVAIIARNEERNLPACLRSAAFADEIVVVEHASSDRTAEIAREYGARVVVTADWPGFGAQKNRALDACTGDWILSLDADERVTPALREKITEALANPRFDVYEMPRLSTYCGRFVRHGGWQPDWCRRLFRHGAARFSDARVHEALVTDRAIGRLHEPLLHYSFRSMDDVINKINRYSSDSAAALSERGDSPGLTTAILHGVAAFVRTYVIKRGFLDGRRGFLLAVSNAEGSYYRYVKAMLSAETRSGAPRDDLD